MCDTVFMKALRSLAAIGFLSALLALPAPSLAFDAAGAAGGIAGGMMSEGYGGQVVFLPIPCTDSGYKKWVVTIGPPSPGLYLVDFTKLLQKPYNYKMWIKPGAWHLGMRKTQMGQCEVCIGNYCYMQPWLYEIDFAGTSK